MLSPLSLSRVVGNPLTSFRALSRGFGTSIHVILEKDIPDRGNKGDVVKVKRGYARNFLIPRGLAVYGTDENLEKYNTKLPNKNADASIPSSTISNSPVPNGINVSAVPVSPVIERIEVKREALPTGLLVKPLSHYEVKILLRYKYRIPAFHVDIAEPIRYLGQYKVNYSRSKSVIIDVVSE